MDIVVLILVILQVANTKTSRTETMDRVIVNQSLTLPCPMKMIPKSGLLQWLFQSHDSSSYKPMCLKKPDETDCVKSTGKEPWLENIEISTESVEIDRVAPHHSGTYQCKYIDGSNLEKYMIVVNVLNPPGKPTIYMSPEIIVEDNIVKLMCETRGSNPRPSLKWIWKDFSNKPIPKRNIINQTVTNSDDLYGNTVMTIFWMPKSFDDGNSISCLAENQLAAVASNWMYLNVNYPPIIYDFPLSPYFALLGTEVNIECKATRKTAAHFQWLTDKNSILSDSALLIIKSISKVHEGAYRCMATNPFGTSSAVVNISVLSSPAIEAMKDVVVTEGEMLKVLCKVIPDHSNVTWWMNSECVSTGSLLEMRLSGVKPVTMECRATVKLYRYPSHFIMASSREVVEVKVRYKPRIPSIVVHPEDDHLTGMDVTITCIPNSNEPGFPKPDYIWKKPSTGWTKNHTNFLTFSSLTFDDAGLYICTVFNLVGLSEEVKFELTVQGQPSMADSNLQSPSLVKVKEHQAISIGCHFKAYPTPEITWLSDDIPVPLFSNTSRFSVDEKKTTTNGFRSVLHISRTLSKSGEIYRCHASNKYGSTSHEFRIQFQYPPKLISNIHLSAADSMGRVPGKGPVYLNCTVSGSPTLYIVWLRKLSNHNENPIENSTERYLILENQHHNVLRSVLYVMNFQNEDYGRYFCLAKNSEGHLETEFEIKKLSMPDPSHGLTLVKQTWNSLTFKWSPGFDGGFRQLFLVSYMTDMQTNPTQLRTDLPNVTLTDLLPDTSYTLTVSSSNKLGTTPATLSIKVKTEALTVNDEKILTINKDDQTLELKLPTNLSSSVFCLTVEEMDGSKDVIGSWTLKKRCIRDSYSRLPIENPSNRFRVKICLIHMPDVCSSAIMNNVASESSETILSTRLIGTVAAACTVLVIVLAILLFFILIRTRRLLPGLSDLKDIKRIRNSSKDDFSGYIHKPLPSMCQSKHGLLMESGGCPLLNTYSCDQNHLQTSPMEIFNICSTHNIFNEGLYSTLIKSSSINHFTNDLSSNPIFNDSTFIDQSSCHCRNDQPTLTMPPAMNENCKPEKIFYEVMV